jgi:hypothetical protein
MSIIPTSPIYVLILDDEGVIGTLLADTDLNSLGEKAINVIGDYLEQFGYREKPDSTPTTEDGFAQIYRASRGETESASTLRTYKFDGEETVAAAQSRLTEAIRNECERLD